MIAQLIEFSPAIAEWLGAKRARKILSGMTIAAVIFGITLSTLHQSGLGALYLMAKDKINPLWYSEFIPLLFFVSSIFAGLSMVIFEGSISHKVFSDQVSEKNHKQHNRIIIKLARICAATLLVYFFMHLLVFIHEKHWEYLTGFYGNWFLFEMLGLVLLPMVMFFIGYQKESINLIKIAALLTMIGIIVNRLNLTVIGFRWEDTVRYVPSWKEIMITATVILTEIWIFRWVVRRLPVFRESPEWAKNK